MVLGIQANTKGLDRRCTVKRKDRKSTACRKSDELLLLLLLLTHEETSRLVHVFDCQNDDVSDIMGRRAVETRF